MAGKTGLVKTEDKITQAINDMLERGKSAAAFLNRVTFEQYKQAQVTRWESEGASEAGKWDAIDFESPYGKRKLSLKPVNGKAIRGGGRATMVLTGTLADAAQGRGAGLLKVVTNRGIKVYIDDSVVPYAKYAAEARPIMVFGPDTKQMMITDLTKYLMRGEE